MADTPDTPPETAAPAPKPRRRAPRAVSTAPAASPKTPRKRTPKPDETAADTSTAAPAKRASASKPPKPRSTKRTTPAPKRRAAAGSTAAGLTEKVGGKWGAAAIVGGIAAAAGAALLTFRSSTPKPALPATPKGGAHQPDGIDSSASFEAGIADENTVPE